MEELWIEKGRPRGDVYQAYVQLAAALEQSRRNHPAGALRLLEKARPKLQELGPDPVETARVLRETEVFLEEPGRRPAFRI